MSKLKWSYNTVVGDYKYKGLNDTLRNKIANVIGTYLEQYNCYSTKYRLFIDKVYTKLVNDNPELKDIQTDIKDYMHNTGHGEFPKHDIVFGAISGIPPKDIKTYVELGGGIELRKKGYKLKNGIEYISLENIKVLSKSELTESSIDHAEYELRRAGLFDDDSDYNGMIGRAVLELMKVFSEQGHSGFSAAWVRDLFNKLSNFETLTPITSDPEEWMDCREYCSDCKDMWQNKRNPAVFSYDGGKTWKNVDDNTIKEGIKIGVRKYKILSESKYYNKLVKMAYRKDPDRLTSLGKTYLPENDTTDKLNVQDLYYKQRPNYLQKAIKFELGFIDLIMDKGDKNKDSVKTGATIVRIPLTSIRPSQSGKNYKNPSSEYESEQFIKFKNNEITADDVRDSDFNPILVNKRTMKIIDGNHKHYAMLKSNEPYAVCLMVDIPKEYLSEKRLQRIKEDKQINNSDILVIVDVQEAFSKYFPNEYYLDKLNDYCEEFKTVYQIWDDIDANTPSYNFPNQKKAIVKQYGFDIEPDAIEMYFSGKEADKLRNDLETQEYKDFYKTKDNRILFYIGNDHKWFLADTPMITLFKNLKGKKVILVGGAEGECLQDIYISMKSCGINVEINTSYIY